MLHGGPILQPEKHGETLAMLPPSFPPGEHSWRRCCFPRSLSLVSSPGADQITFVLVAKEGGVAS
jgi:hypothetical protein